MCIRDRLHIVEVFALADDIDAAIQADHDHRRTIGEMCIRDRIGGGEVDAVAGHIDQIEAIAERFAVAPVIVQGRVAGHVMPQRLLRACHAGGDPGGAGGCEPTNVTLVVLSDQIRPRGGAQVGLGKNGELGEIIPVIELSLIHI